MAEPMGNFCRTCCLHQGTTTLRVPSYSGRVRLLFVLRVLVHACVRLFARC